MSIIEAPVLQALCDCDMTSFTGPKCEDGEFSNLVTLENYKYFDIQYWLTTSFLVWWLTIEKNYKSLTHNIDWQPVFLSADLLLNTTIFYFQYWLTAVDLQFSSESVALEWGSKTGLAKHHLAPDKSSDTEVICHS